jgi:hypothetical protein
MEGKNSNAALAYRQLLAGRVSDGGTADQPFGPLHTYICLRCGG